STMSSVPPSTMRRAVADAAISAAPALLGHRAERELDLVDLLALAEVHHVDDLLPRHARIGVDGDGHVGLAQLDVVAVRVADQRLQLVVGLDRALAEHAPRGLRVLVPE